MPRALPALATLVALTALATCGGSPPQPSPPSPPPPLVPPRPAVNGLRIEGPASVAPGATASYRSIATFIDGTTADVTSESTWTSTNVSVLTIQSPGNVRGANRGEAALQARFGEGGQSRYWHVYVLVLEDGTFRLTGRVQESGTGLPGAQVEVVSGTGTGLRATTGASGSYALYGLAGEVRVDVTLEGFDRASQTIRVSENMSADITMRPTITPTDLNGAWTMSLTASAGCVPAFPEDVRARNYTAVISQTGTALKLDIQSAAVSNNQIDGIVVDRTLTLFLPTDDFYYPFYGIRYYSLVEELNFMRLLAIAGTARGRRDGDSVTGTLSGEFAIYGSGNNNSVRQRQVSCQRDDHAFRLTR